MSIYLLDSSICIAYLRDSNPNVVERLRNEPTQNIRLCSVVLGELYCGAFRSADPAKNLALLSKFIGKFASVPFDDDAARIYGEERARLERLGTRIGPHDMQIAAIALASGLKVVTHNTAEFARVRDLAVEDWQLDR